MSQQNIASINMAAKSRQNLQHKSLESARSTRTMNLGHPKDPQQDNLDRIMRLAQLTQEHRIGFGKRNRSVISKESALSIRLKKDLEKKSDIRADETLKNIQMVNLWPQTN